MFASGEPASLIVSMLLPSRAVVILFALVAQIGARELSMNHQFGGSIRFQDDVIGVNSLNGCGSITAVHGAVVTYGNSVLYSFHDCLTSVDGDLIIEANSALTSLDGRYHDSLWEPHLCWWLSGNSRQRCIDLCRCHYRERRRSSEAYIERGGGCPYI